MGNLHDCLFCQFARQEREIEFFANFSHCYVIKDQCAEEFYRFFSR